VPAERLTANFDASSRAVLSTQDIPMRTENAPIVGESAVLTLDDLKVVRPQAVAFRLATHLQKHHFKDSVWLFPQLLAIVRRLEALAAPPAGPAAAGRGRLAGAELQELLRFIVRGQEFFAFDADALDRELRREYVYDGQLHSPYDGLTTRIRLRTADREHEATWHQLASAAVVFPEAKRLHQLHRVEQRLRNVLLVQVAGGPARVDPLADWTTRRLRPTCPTRAPFTAADLSGHAPAADGSGVRMTFSRGNKTDGTDFFSATVFVPAQGLPSLVQVIPGPASQRPTRARRLCGDLLPEAGP
jgi:hypothetical protein